MFRRALQQASRTRLPTSPSATAVSPYIQNTTSLLQRRNATVLHRWSSTASGEPLPTKPEQPEFTDTVAKPDGAAKDAVPAGNGELEAAKKEVVDLKDKYLRSVADFRNLQERTKREVASSKDFAIQKFAKDLLESIDNLDRALSTVPVSALTPPTANQELVSLHDGLKMTEKILLSTLEKHGLTRVNPEGEKFNPNLHEATFEVPVEGKEVGSVMHVQSKGWVLNGRTLRAAKVGVVKAP